MADIVDIIIVCLSFLIFLHHWRSNRNSPITKWPIIGMLPGLLHNTSRIHNYFTQIMKQSDHFAFVFKGPWFSDLNVFMTSNPTDVQHIFCKNFANYPRGPQFNKIFEPLGDGIFNAEDVMWRTQRKIIHSLLKDNKYEIALRKTIQQKVENGLIPILDRVSKSGIFVDLQDLFQRLTFDNICILVLGFDPNCLSVELPEVAYEKALDDIEKGIMYRHLLPESLWKLQKWLQIGEEKTLSKAVETFDEFVYDCISTKRQHLLNSRKTTLDDDEFDFLTPILVHTEDENNEMSGLGKSNKFLRDMTMNLLAAGKSTLSAGLVWFVWLVATHPSVEKKILDELKENLIEKQSDDQWNLTFNAEEVSKLVYLHGAICESLRLYPPVPFEHRCSVQEDTLPSGHRVDANTRLIVSIYSMGRNEEIWGKDCLEFKPERWISEQGRIIHVPSYKFFPFSAGPRTCLGKDMAFVQIKMVATSIIWNYHVRVKEGQLITPIPSIILDMKHGLKVSVTRRSHV